MISDHRGSLLVQANLPWYDDNTIHFNFLIINNRQSNQYILYLKRFKLKFFIYSRHKISKNEVSDCYLC